MKEDFFGPSTGIFVGRYGYPDVSMGPLASLQLSEAQDNPARWFGLGYEEIIGMRSSLLRSKKQQSIYSSSRFVQDSQLLAMSSKPADVEMSFMKKPVYRVSFSSVHQPMGPSARLKNMAIADNVRIAPAVEKAVSDSTKASDASFGLYMKGEDVYKITNILSSGILGTRKKVVPTRWSITATDDIITKKMLTDVRGFKQISDCTVFESAYMDNTFIILAMPGAWEYENFEAYAPRKGAFQIVEEYEPFFGRTAYAEKEGGGYYAARLGVVEWLFHARRQARVVVFREIGEGYIIPLGVWQVRENVRNAMKHPTKLSSMDDAMAYIKSRLRLPLAEYMKRSAVLRQRRLGDFFKAVD